MGRLGPGRSTRARAEARQASRAAPAAARRPGLQRAVARRAAAGAKAARRLRAVDALLDAFATECADEFRRAGDDAAGKLRQAMDDAGAGAEANSATADQSLQALLQYGTDLTAAASRLGQ